MNSHAQPRYKDPRYAVSRPPMVTAAHNKQVEETSLRPREETAPLDSQLAASCFMVRWKCHVTTKAMIRSVNFTSNMPSARYCPGFVIHNVTPLMIWHAAANQMNGRSLFIEVYGIVRNSPNRRRPMINVRPTTVAVPKAWIVSASGQPQDSLTHSAYEVCSSQLSTAIFLDRYGCRTEPPSRAFWSTNLFKQ